MTAKDAKTRQAEFKQRQIDKGYVRRGYYATPAQHEKLTKVLAREQKKDK